MNDIPIGILFSVLGVLILLSGFFSGSETALVSLNRYRLKHLVNSGHKGAQMASSLLERPDRLFGLILIFNNFVNILASAIATVIGLKLFGEAGIAIATGVLTFVILIFSEVTPKTYAAQYPERLAFPAAYALKLLMWMFYPLVYFINTITNGLLKLFGIHKTGNNDSLSPEELRTIVNETGSMIPVKHQKMLLNILDLEAVKVEDIMVARNEIVGLDMNEDWDEILEQMTHSLHTRVPVYKNNIDHIFGFIHLRKALTIVSTPGSCKEDLKKIISPCYFIPEATPLNKQLLNFQKNKRRTALVVDEYGDIQGIVTLEDILEEIVGEFTTDPADTLMKEVLHQDDGTVLVDGSANIRELNRMMSWHLPTNSAKTINGLILEFLQSIPEPSTSVLINNYAIEIKQVTGNTVKTVLIEPQINKELDS
ncbi:MAG: HlyC/CorC family transporter [gamma proteobacterium symbiont of Bathyaustriella thionipta]|nr:HlyC/CorC family transporter [gamma proteobacterium symbiont of Bathyaustriella thionipta]MCU7950333.1 HlyC/CorC family transporter [gamma proteobacterium symbiont of Bathyaustriella thionipta]MCU7952005.1 HlyC/CorC family transporter [gamma proteobacterium symbiont of Bathyaustriella thionipta]MCU7956857.1 HlyC/CorC family transporter [gamma proteobacterium symbiont of Bathyaustriella thionipta]MCU7967478.1 HlyC/CorC family transporter [gamma proteobacterium symbiont of Bathyaustriella thio